MTGRQLSALGVGLILAAAPTVWIVWQQAGGAVTYLNCEAMGSPSAVAVGLAATAACAIVAWRSWVLRHQGSEARRFLMRIAAGTSAIFALAALTMTVAILLVPACAR